MGTSRSQWDERSALGVVPSIGVLLLRVGVGSMMLVHGVPKLLHFSERAARFPDPLGVGSTTSLALAVFGEVFCSIAIILGLGTRFAAIPFLITMLVALGVVHAGDPWSDRELAALYAVSGLALVFLGGGRFSLDALIAPRMRRR
jgi:putative oxidoreductase